MGKRLAITFCLLAVGLAVAYVVYSRMFAEPAPAVVHPQPTPTLPADAAPAATPPVDARPAVRVGILDASGTVQRLRRDGLWETVQKGDKLSVDDVIRTRGDSQVVLDVDGATVEVPADSQLALPDLVQGAGIQLIQGRIQARVPDRDRAFQVSVAGSDIVAETEAGDFAVATTGAGEATVASERGSVRVRAADKTVEVKAGEQSVVEKNQAPSAPKPIPPSLFLKLQQSRRVQRNKEYAVKGKTSPGAIVSVNGVRLQADADGSFAHVLTLREGKNQINVSGTDVTGRSEAKKLTVKLDSRPPSASGQMDWN